VSEDLDAYQWAILDAFEVRGIERILIFLFARFALDSGRGVCHRARLRAFQREKFASQKHSVTPLIKVNLIGCKAPHDLLICFM
jgi:hypothetical protein